jgi:transcriptional regulator with PAS, ATPase and Fis domain
MLCDDEKIDLPLVEQCLPPERLDEAVGRIDVTLRSDWGLKEILADVERKLLASAWDKHGSQAAAARALGIGSQQAFQRKCRALGISCHRRSNGGASSGE